MLSETVGRRRLFSRRKSQISKPREDATASRDGEELSPLVRDVKGRHGFGLRWFAAPELTYKTGERLVEEQQTILDRTKTQDHFMLDSIDSWGRFEDRLQITVQLTA
jgi:hypothetical protein